MYLHCGTKLKFLRCGEKATGCKLNLVTGERSISSVELHVQVWGVSSIKVVLELQIHHGVKSRSLSDKQSEVFCRTSQIEELKAHPARMITENTSEKHVAKTFYSVSHVFVDIEKTSSGHLVNPFSTPVLDRREKKHTSLQTLSLQRHEKLQHVNKSRT